MTLPIVIYMSPAGRPPATPYLLKALATFQDMKKSRNPSFKADEDDFRRLKAKTKEEIQTLKAKLENDYQSVQQLVQERLKFTLELAKDAESNWKMATPTDRVVLLKSVLWNFSLDGLNVRYDLKKPFALLSQIKTKATLEKWCPARDLNPHACALDPKSSVSANFTSGACGTYFAT